MPQVTFYNCFYPSIQAHTIRSTGQTRSSATLNVSIILLTEFRSVISLICSWHVVRRSSLAESLLCWVWHSRASDLRSSGLLHKKYRQKSYFSDILTLEDWTERLSRNVGKELPLHAAKEPWKEHISSITRRKPAVTHRRDCFYLFESVGTSLADANRLQDTPTWNDNIKYHNEGTESKNVNKIQMAK